MLLYEHLLCIYDVIMIYLKICWFYFSFFFFFKIDTDIKYTAPYRWNKPLKQNMDEHFNCSENLIVYKKKKIKKKSTTDYITRNSKFKPHCQQKKVRKKVIEVGFFSAEICTWMHLKYDFVRFSNI